MSSFLIHSLELTVLLMILLNVECTIEPVKCYQCEVSENHLCTDEYLQPCPGTHYDSCLTRISKTKGNQAWIYKNCALAPCTLRDHSQSTGLGLDYCDRSQEEYDCFSCCKGDGCNKSSGFNFAPSVTLLSTLLLLTTFTTFYKCN